MKVEVGVEVTDEVRRTSTGKEQQVVYVDLGDRYPVQMTMWVNDQPLKPGRYMATKLRKGRYDITLDLERGLVPAAAGKAA